MNLYDGRHFQIAALYNVPHAFDAVLRTISAAPEEWSCHGCEDHQAVQIDDLRTQPPYLRATRRRRSFDLAGARTLASYRCSGK